MKRRPEECYDLIENMTAHHNDWDTSTQRSESSSSITSSFNIEIAALKAEMAEINKNLMRVLQPPLAILKTYMLQEPIKANDAILKNMQTNMTSLINSNLELKNMFGQFMKINTASSSGLGTLPLECETEATKDTVHPTNNGSTEDVQPLVVLTESLIFNSKPVISPISEPVASPVRIMLKTINNHSKSGNIKHDIESLHQKPDQRAFFYKNQANEAKCQKIESLRTILANSAKLKSKEN
nr:reverse transcriptase domain-containing protein [Tanacetum cinerariifolium]